ncbi:methyltransferase family protein [Streptomyces sp. NPDC050509]|uniref:methyltransferase family protein n=1 Tax=Streptomyces sp. NPDC050509 TaxID=3365620 RepID=UPI0037A3734D
MSGWAWTALALYLVWLTAAFGWRSVLQRRRTGDTGFRGLSGRPGSASWWAGVLFLTALLGAALAPAATLAGLPVFIDGATAPHAAGVAVTVVGIGATLAAQTAMGSSWRVGVDRHDRTALVTGGPFAYVRNPIFTAMAVTGAGLTLTVPNVLALAAFVALVVAIELQVRVIEEPYLRQTHGPAYLEYSARAGRFVPGIGRHPARAADPGD